MARLCPRADAWAVPTFATSEIAEYRKVRYSLAASKTVTGRMDSSTLVSVGTRADGKTVRPTDVEAPQPSGESTGFQAL
jgi:hypothetical protein